MRHRQLTLEQAAALLKMTPSALKSLAVQGEIDATPRGDGYVFFQDELELWQSAHVIKGDLKQGKRPRPGVGKAYPSLSDYCPPECVCCHLEGTSRASILKSLTELADQSGFLYDPEDFRAELIRREEAGSTNFGKGVAVPHTMVRDEGYFSESFICLAKLEKPSYFNSAPDGSVTELLIASCSRDNEEHLHILQQIVFLCQNPAFMERVRQAESDEELFQALVDCQPPAETF